MHHVFCFIHVSSTSLPACFGLTIFFAVQIGIVQLYIIADSEKPVFYTCTELSSSPLLDLFSTFTTRQFGSCLYTFLQMGRFRPSFAPLAPSSLRILSGPISPASSTSSHIPMLFPKFSSPQAKIPPAFQLSNQISVEPPSTPMPWIWSCHRCHTRYLLGATRRCLHDGHYFCGGITVDKVSGKVKKHKACISKFDYTG